MKVNIEMIAKEVGDLHPTIIGSPFSVEMTINNIYRLNLHTECKKNYAYLLSGTNFLELSNQDLAEELKFIVVGKCPDRRRISPKWKILELDTEDELDQVYDRLLQVLDLYNCWDADLSESILAGNPLQKQMDIAVRHFPDPVALFDTSFSLIAYAGKLPETIEDPIWKNVVEYGFGSIQALRPGYLGFLEANMDSVVPLFYPEIDIPSENRYISAILRNRNGTPIAFLAMDEITAKYENADLSIIYHIQKRLECSDALFKEIGMQENSSHVVFAKLVNGEGVSEDLKSKFYEEMKWRKSDHYSLLAISKNAVWEPVTPEEYVSYVRRLKRVCPFLQYYYYDKQIIGIMQSKEREQEFLTAEISRFLDVTGIRIGVSMSIKGYEYLTAALQQAKTSLSYCSDRNRIVFYGDIFGRAVIDSLTEDRQIPLKYCDPILFPLLGLQEKGQDLLNTLYNYLDNGCNVKRTAEKSNMHRNTVSYRIAAIEDIIGISLEDLDNEQMERIKISMNLLNLWDKEYRRK